MRNSTAAVPVIAVVGRPNVGKSTLVNRIIGRREAVVEDIPGVTRDRVAYDAEWSGRSFTVIDTGGWDPRSAGLSAEVSAAAQVAVELADAVLFVVDAVRGATEIDAEVARILQRSGKPVVLAANKVDDLRAEADATALWNLGLGEPLVVSALHGRGSGELLDAMIAALPEFTNVPDNSDGVRRVALVGRPNVGKSSLLNRLAGEQRALVDDVAGTTRDPVDSLIQINDSTWRFVDTAGLRRKVRQATGSEYYSSLRTAAALESAEVAVVLLDASEPLTEQDIRVMEAVIEAGRAMVIGFNKWDLMADDRRERLDREIDRDLARVAWAPRLNVSALTGRGVGRLATALQTALDGWEFRVPTAELNQFLAELIAATPPPVRGGKQPRVLFATQPDTSPPRFVLFTTGPLEDAYKRFIERRLRERFGFTGTPIELSVRPRVRRGK